jgi:NAD dependent epimerase/dehydratase family
MEVIIEAAAAAGARLVFADNLYAYGPVDGPLTEDLPYLAKGPNDWTRARIADILMRAHEAGRIQATIGRGSDFFGPYAHLSTVGDRVFARAIEGKPAQVLGNPDLPHTVTYIQASPGRWSPWVSGMRPWARCGTSRTPGRSRCAGSCRWCSKQQASLPVCGPRLGGGSPSPPCSIRRCERSESSSTSPSDRGWSIAPSSREPSAGRPRHCPRRSPRRSRGSGIAPRGRRAIGGIGDHPEALPHCGPHGRSGHRAVSERDLRLLQRPANEPGWNITQVTTDESVPRCGHAAASATKPPKTRPRVNDWRPRRDRSRPH